VVRGSQTRHLPAGLGVSAEVVVKKLLLLSVAALVMGACSEGTTAPPASKKAPPSSAKSDDTFSCRSGYVVAYDENGNPYCVQQ
jgi:uncharacterized lipoprotein NlpE involved in copper resistance